jgi:hypothetical protein
VPLFEKVKRGIKASPRMSRTEAFLQYAEENPHEVLQVIEEENEAKLRQLEKEHREAERAYKRGPRRRRYTPEELADVPF